MSVSYTEFRHLYPPRTKSRVPYTDNPVIRQWKKFGDSICQFKMDGTNTQVVVYPDRHIELFTRHKLINPQRLDAVANYTLPDSLRARILGFSPKDVFSVYNAELLHHKKEVTKHTLYFFDVLVWGGFHLIATEYSDRHKIIWDCLRGKQLPLDLPKLEDDIYVAHNILPADWDTAWKLAQPSQYCEGLVLKRTGATSRLQIASSEVNNGGWMCRCRKPKKNYQF